jgi:hypothetical protein
LDAGLLTSEPIISQPDPANLAGRHSTRAPYDERVTSPTPGPQQFLSDTPLGTRVVVRYRVEGGLTDALGDLVARADGGCTVRTRRADVVIPLGLVVAAKEVPPAPPRRPRGHALP